MTTKLAVPPVPPSVVAVEPAVPQTWQEAFNYLTDRFMRVIGKQATVIAELRTGLEDARGLIAAGDRARAELQTRLDAVSDSFSSSLQAHETNVTERLNGFGETIVKATGWVADVERQVKDDGEAIKTIVKGLCGLEDAVGKLGGRLDDEAAAVAETIETLSDRVTVVVRRADGVDAVLDAIEPRLASVADLLTMTGERLDAEARARAELAGAVERSGEELAAVSGRVAVLAGALDQETKARTVAVAAVARQVEEYAATASSEDAALDASVTAMDAATSARLDAVERGMKLVDEAHGITAGRVRDLDDTVAAVRRETQAHALAIEDDRARLGAAEDGIAAFIATAAAAGAEIKTFDVRLTQIQGEAADACRRVTIALGEMPAAMMIDRRGHLVRTSRSGETVDLGCVISDGRDAADIVAARVEKGRLIFTRSDRTEFGCEMPVPTVEPAVVVKTEPTPVGYLSKNPDVRAAQVEDMKKMRADKQTYEKIGEKYGTSARHVVRLLKGDDK